MLPTLTPDTFVLIDAARSPAVDDLVVAVHPQKKIEICKRVAAVLPDGGVELASDNAAAGQDSRHFGPVSRSGVRGVITHVFGSSGGGLGSADGSAPAR